MNDKELARRFPLTYIRTIARRQNDIQLQPYCWPDGGFTLPHSYERKEMLPNAS